MKKTLLLLAVIMVCVLVFAGCTEPITGASVPYDNIEDLSEAVGFNVLEPPLLPDGYVKSGYYSLEDEVAEILYMNGKNQILYSMSEIKNVESDITDYDEMYITDIGGNYATLTLKDGYIVFGTVTIGDYTYSLYCPMGLSSGEFDTIAQTFGKTEDEVMREAAKLLEQEDSTEQGEEATENAGDDGQSEEYTDEITDEAIVVENADEPIMDSEV